MTTTTPTTTGCALRAPEKNHYFSGKLLTSRDCKDEQDFHNEKRRLINRLVLGEGIVCGLHTSQAQGQATAVTLTPGVAIDCCGHEIVVDKELTAVDLTQLEGFPQVAGVRHLCLAYDECLREAVPVPAGDASCEETCEHNRIRETYKLKLVDAHTATRTSVCELARSQAMLVEALVWQLRREAPRWVNPGEIFEVRLTLTRKPVKPAALPAISVTVTEKLAELTAISGLDAQGKVTLSLAAGAEEPAVKTYLVQAGVRNGTITAQVAVAGQVQAPPLRAPISSVEVVSGSVAEQIANAFFESDYGRCHECSGDHCVSLAAITLQASGGSLEIASVNTFPQQSFVYGNDLLFELLACMETRIGSPGSQGPPGQAGKDGKDGLAGEDGKDGRDGKDGAPGAGGGRRVTAGIVGVRVTGGSFGEETVSSGLPVRVTFCVVLALEPAGMPNTFAFGPPIPNLDAFVARALLPESPTGSFRIQVFSSERPGQTRVVRVCWFAIEGPGVGTGTGAGTGTTATETPREEPAGRTVAVVPLTDLPGIGPARAARLEAAGIADAAALAAASPQRVAEALEMQDLSRAEALIAAAREAIGK